MAVCLIFKKSPATVNNVPDELKKLGILQTISTHKEKSIKLEQTSTDLHLSKKNIVH